MPETLSPSKKSSPRQNPVANRILPEDRPFHEWYRFVLSYPPHLVRDYLERFEASKGQCILDPFAGTGTTPVECKRRRFKSVGVESHPMSHFAGRVKADWRVQADQLVSEAESVAKKASKSLGLNGNTRDFLPLYERAPISEDSLSKLTDEESKLLLKNSISPVPLHKVLALRSAIGKHASEATRDHLRLALAKTTVSDASNLHFGPEVGLGAIIFDAPVIEAWLRQVYQMAGDLRGVEKGRFPTVNSIRGDAREIGSCLPAHSVDFVITSPPYPNEKDYTRTTRLESVILGMIRDKAELRQLKQGLLRSNTRNIYKADTDHQWADQLPSIKSLANEIEARRLELGKTSGFERLYHQVARQYFGGMARHFESLRTVLKPGARLAYVVGDQASFFRIMIRTGQLLAEIAESLGYEVQSIDLFRTRMATATRAELREEVVVLRWNG